MGVCSVDEAEHFSSAAGCGAGINRSCFGVKSGRRAGPRGQTHKQPFSHASMGNVESQTSTVGGGGREWEGAVLPAESPSRHREEELHSAASVGCDFLL